MEQTIRQLAHASVMRGCAFGMLGVVTGMMGFADQLPVALKWGGLGTLLMAFVLILKASRADRVAFRSTEVWIMLDKDQRPPESLAPVLIANARREAMLHYAYLSAIIAALLLGGGLFLVLVR